MPGTSNGNIFPSASGHLYLDSDTSSFSGVISASDEDDTYTISGVISASDEDGAGLCGENYFFSPLKGIEILDEPLFGGYIHSEKSWNIAIDGINNNNPPNAIIDVSPSNTVEAGTTVTLNGSRSNDPDPGDSIISYRWTQTEGPDLGLGILNTPTIQFIAPQVTQILLLLILLPLLIDLGITPLYNLI